VLKTVCYWVFTGLLTAWLLLGGVVDSFHGSAPMAILHTLGYPAYLGSILGAGKLLAVLALLYPRTRFLREWAYAGVTFDALGAFFSHVAVRDGAVATFAPLLLLAIAIASYQLRPARWRLYKGVHNAVAEAA
jgi:hypothetical protein